MVNYFHVRINNKSGQPSSDFGIFMGEILTRRESVWDKDNANKIKKGDYLGFITGPKDNEIVYIFLVKEEHPSQMRPSHWAVGKPHVDGNGNSAVDDRGVITLTNNHKLPKQVEWSHVRRATGLGGDCATWMPRGTQRVVRTSKLPFSLP
jgi:hypothetical protein